LHFKFQFVVQFYTNGSEHIVGAIHESPAQACAYSPIFVSDGQLHSAGRIVMRPYKQNPTAR